MHMHDLAYSPKIVPTRNDTLGINSTLGKKKKKKREKNSPIFVLNNPERKSKRTKEKKRSRRLVKQGGIGVARRKTRQSKHIKKAKIDLYRLCIKE